MNPPHINVIERLDQRQAQQVFDPEKATAISNV